MLHSRDSIHYAAVLLLFGGCTRPPAVPEGLGQSLRHLIGGFYGPDEEVSAGLTGLLQWYEEEGYGLLGTSADIDNIGAFELGELTHDDVSALAPRTVADPRDATGVIAVAELPCQWQDADRMLVRPDQDDVFTDFDFYDRTYVNSRAAYDGARQDDQFSASDALDPSDPSSVPSDVLLLTENSTSGTELGVTIPFELNMHARHGSYLVLEESTRAGLYVTWMPTRAEAAGGVNTMEQSYTFEVDLAYGDKTLWIYASWAQVETGVFASDSTMLMAVSVTKAQGTAQRMADVCEGRVELAGW